MLGGAAAVFHSSPTHTVLAGSRGYFYLHVALACSCFLTLTVSLRKGPPQIFLTHIDTCAHSLLFQEHMHSIFSFINMVLFLTGGGGGCFTDPRCLLACYFASWLWFASSSWLGVVLGTASLYLVLSFLASLSMCRSSHGEEIHSSIFWCCVQKHDSYFRRGRFRFGTGYISLNRQ